MDPAPTTHKIRRRTLLGAVLILALVSGSLAAFLVRQVSSELTEFRQAQARLLDDQLQAALNSLQVLEDVALDDVARCPEGATNALRDVTETHRVASIFALLASCAIVTLQGKRRNVVEGWSSFDSLFALE